jgi:hypothetical protein
MKKIFIPFCFVFIFLAAFSSQPKMDRLDANQTLTPAPSDIATTASPAQLQPTLEPTITPSPAAAIESTAPVPVSLYTPIPIPGEKIAEGNLSSLSVLAEYKPVSNGDKVVKLSGDGSIAYVVSDDGVDIFKTGNSEFIRHLDIQPRVDSRGYVDGIDVIKVNKDGTRFLIWTDEKEFSLLTSEGEVLQKVLLKNRGGTADISPDGTLIAYDDSSLYKGSFAVINTNTGEKVFDWKSGVGGQVHGASPKFSLDGKYLATRISKGLWDKLPGEVYIWDTTNWKRASNYSVENYGAYDFSSTNTYLGLADSKGIRVWDLNAKKSVLSIENENKCKDHYNHQQLKISRSEEFIIVLSCNTYSVWNIRTGAKVRENETSIMDLDSILFDNFGEITEFSIPTINTNNVIDPPWTRYLYPKVFEFMEDNSRLVFNFKNVYYMKSCFLTVKGESDCISDPSVVTNTGAINLLSVNEDKQMEIRASKEEDATVKIGNIGYVPGLPDVAAMTGDKLFFNKWSNPNNSTATLYEYASGQNKVLASWPGGAFSRVSFSGDRRLAAFYIWKNPKVKLVIMDLVKRQTILTNDFQAASGWWWGPQLSSDGKLVAVSIYESKKIFTRIISLENTKSIIEMKEDTDKKSGVETSSSVFSADGSLLITGYDDGHINIFRASDGQLIHTITGKRGQIRGLAASSDGLYLAVTKNNGAMQILGSSNNLAPRDY